MRIKTKLQILIIVTIVFFTSIIFWSFLWQKEVGDLYKQRELVKELLFNIFAGNQLKAEYFIYRGDRSKEQWNIIHKEIGEDLVKISIAFTSPEEKASINSLISFNKDIRNLFNQIVKHDESLTDRGAISKELRERIISQMMVISNSQYLEGLKFLKSIDKKMAFLSFPTS